MSFFDKDVDVTSVLLSLQNSDSPGVYFSGFDEQVCVKEGVSSFPVLCDGLTQNEYFVIQFIHNSKMPCVKGVPLMDVTLPTNPFISSLYRTGGLQNVVSESQCHLEVTFSKDDGETPSYSDIKREFDMVYNVCTCNDAAMDLLQKALRDTLTAVLQSCDHMNVRNERSTLVSPFPQIDTRKRSRRLGL